MLTIETLEGHSTIYILSDLRFQHSIRIQTFHPCSLTETEDQSIFVGTLLAMTSLPDNSKNQGFTVIRSNLTN